jgi:hypothetical protein
MILGYLAMYISLPCQVIHTLYEIKLPSINAWTVGQSEGLAESALLEYGITAALVMYFLLHC